MPGILLSLLLGIGPPADAQASNAPLAPLSARLQNEQTTRTCRRSRHSKFSTISISTPGHTPGTTSIEMTVTDAGRPYKAFLFGGSASAPGAAAAEQFLKTVRRIEEVQQGVQVRLVNHGFSDPQFWSRVDRLGGRKPGDPHPFVAPDAFLPWLQQLKAEATKQVEVDSRR